MFATLAYSIAWFVFLFSWFPLPNCPGLLDAAVIGGFSIATCNCMICSFKVMISSPYPSLCQSDLGDLPQVCHYIQTKPYEL